jgi:hypothetical protein
MNVFALVDLMQQFVDGGFDEGATEKNGYQALLPVS